MTKLAVIIPSRGLSFSRTMQELLRELEGIDHEFYFAVGLPLPDCFNVPVKQALKNKSITHVLICEDDMILPKGILKHMLRQEYPVVALDYPFKADGDATTLHDPEGFGLYTGTGFMLIYREILDLMPLPIFRTDTAWEAMITVKDELIFFPRDVSDMKTYGLHDVHFGLTLWSAGIPILVPERTAGQRKLVAMGKKGVNDGAHDIIDITRVWRNNTTKNEEEATIKRYLERINRIKTVQILDEKPDYIYYEDGQARAKGIKHEVI